MYLVLLPPRRGKVAHWVGRNSMYQALLTDAKEGRRSKPKARVTPICGAKPFVPNYEAREAEVRCGECEELRKATG